MKLLFCDHVVLRRALPSRVKNNMDTPILPYRVTSDSTNVVVKWSHFGVCAVLHNPCCHNCCLPVKNKGILLWGNMGWWFCSPECIFQSTIEGGKLLSLLDEKYVFMFSFS
jgi:hypothetical protein